MSDYPGDKMSTSLERLIDKMEKIYESQALESNKTENILVLLDRLSVILTRMEAGKKFDTEIGKKIDLLNRSLEQNIEKQQKIDTTPEEEDKIYDKVIHGTRLFGLVLSALANSIQYSVENIGTALGKSSDSANLIGNQNAMKTQVDMASILLPITNIVKSLVDEKMNQKEMARELNCEDSTEAEKEKI